MVSIHETAYPRFKPDLTDTELADIYMPSEQEVSFCAASTKQMAGRLALLCQLKTTQRLGYFVRLIDVPQNIILYIARCIGTKAPSRSRLREFDQSGTRARFIALTRSYLNMKSDRTEVIDVAREAAQMASETKQELADIVNIIIEELVRNRCELPGFTVLVREAKDMRAKVNDALFTSIEQSLSAPEKKRLDAMLTTSAQRASSDWHQLKREPRKPTNKEVRSYLKHIEWLKSWVDRLPAINHIPAAKWRQFVLEARALDAADLKRLKPGKRYSLMVILIHAQLRVVMDDVVEIFTKKVKALHKVAQERLEEYHLQQVRRAEKLIGQFRDILTLFQVFPISAYETDLRYC